MIGRSQYCELCWETRGEAKQNSFSSVHGALLRLRVENQLGYKMLKWIERIEFVELEKKLGRGEGTENEDDILRSTAQNLTHAGRRTPGREK